MKKITILLLALVLCFGSLSGCKSKENSEGEEPNSETPKEKEYAITLTAPEGWEETAGTGILMRYRKDSGDFWVTQKVAAGTIESAIDRYKETEEQGGYTIHWGEISDVKLGSEDAKYLPYTVETSSLKMRYDAYFIQKGSALFSVICLSIPDTDYETLKADYEAMLGSVAITEK